MTAPSAPRRVLLVVHTGRADAVTLAREVAQELCDAGIEVCAESEEAIALVPCGVVTVDAGHAAEGCELVVVLGGDGTILRGAELARPYDVPLLGVNLGHVGFLAEAEVEEVSRVVRAVVDRTWTVEERTTLDVLVTLDGATIARTWALNEASVEKASRERMLDVLVEVDDRPLSRWGCDGVVAATPTGSTAYAFSAGGPVVWPEVEALLVVPISAHALFARPLVVSPSRCSPARWAASCGATADASWSCRRARAWRSPAMPSRCGWLASRQPRSPTGSSPSSASLWPGGEAPEATRTTVGARDRGAPHPWSRCHRRRRAGAASRVHRRHG